MVDFIDDAAGDFIEHVVWDARPVGGHEVGGGDAAESEGVIVRTEITHDADGAGRGQHGKILIDGAIESSIRDLFAIDGVGIAENVELFFGDLAHDADGEAWAWEWLAPNEIIGEAELEPELEHFIFEEHAQRFDEPFEIDNCWQTADVVVALDDGCVAAATLDDVWIDGTLCEIIDSTDLLAFVLKNAD